MAKTPQIERLVDLLLDWGGWQDPDLEGDRPKGFPISPRSSDDFDVPEAPIDRSNDLPRRSKAGIGRTDVPKDEHPILNTPNLGGESRDDSTALQLLQDILVEPELWQVKDVLGVLEQKVSLIESKVHDPAMEEKLASLEAQLGDRRDLDEIHSQLSQVTQQQQNLPQEITLLRDRLDQLEQKLYEPDELIQLLLPIVANLLSQKVTQSKSEICAAIVPIIDDVIHTRSQQDRDAMSRALADIIPAAISTEMKNSPDTIAKAIAPEIGAAMREQIRIDRHAIADALAPEMGAAIKRQIVIERDAMVDALYPVIGNTISRYLSEAIRAINQKVEQAFSFQGMQRKIRARVRGVSEAELIIQESMPVTVQAVFLIHKASGLVISSGQQSDLDATIPALEGDLLAGMLTAIRSFVNDCLSQPEQVSELSEIEYGGSKIVMEVAGYAYFATVIQGEPNQRFITHLRETFATLIQKYELPIKHFNGDMGQFPYEGHQMVAAFLDPDTLSPAARVPRAIFILLAVLGIGIATPWAIARHQQHRTAAIRETLVKIWQAEPNLAPFTLTPSVDLESERITITGQVATPLLKQRAIALVQEQVPQFQINDQIRLITLPPDPRETARAVTRMAETLQVVAVFTPHQRSVRLELTAQTPLPATQVVELFSQIPGIVTVTAITTQTLSPIATHLFFGTGISTLNPNQRPAILNLMALLQRYPDLDIEIIGSSDGVGDPLKNQELALRRAESVRDELIRRGVLARRLQLSTRIEPLNRPNPRARTVSFRWQSPKKQ
ncbi:MAG: OmpA family protein [Oscillatoriales cyanobacterium SM2_2_1]|nr:OmpA family protein [Oscillatoriales cyanobacterium SM2_2_1]